VEAMSKMLTQLVGLGRALSVLKRLKHRLIWLGVQAQSSMKDWWRKIGEGD
jgi:hypothetical protein